MMNEMASVYYKRSEIVPTSYDPLSRFTFTVIVSY